LTYSSDASDLFEEPDTVLWIDDYLWPVQDAKLDTGEPLAFFDFEARGEKGEMLIGTVFTVQSPEEVERILDEALDSKKMIQITGSKTTAKTAAGHNWIRGVISVASRISPTSQTTTSH
jgi:hypothetical protein